MEKPPPNDFFYRHIRLVIFLVFLGALVLNHLIHNRGKEIDIEIPITKKLIINRDTLKRWSKKK